MTREEVKHIVDVAFDVPLAVRRNGEDRTYLEDEIREAKNMAIKALEQEPCDDVPDTNVGDTISRQAAIDALSHMCSEDENGITVSRANVNSMLKVLPFVTPQPKTGHWIYDKSIDNWRCSECNETPKTMGYVGTADFMTEHFKFCNHCGAKMSEPQESEDKE